MLDELRRAVRTLLKSPAYTGTAVITLALALVANTTVFSLLNGILLRDIPVTHPERLAVLTTSNPGSSYQGGLTFRMYEILQQWAESPFERTIGWSGVGVQNVQAGSQDLRGACVTVSGGFFADLGTHALRGRVLDERDVDEQSLQPAMVAVIGEAFWRHAFAARDDIVGQIVRVEGHAFTIVGVAPAGFKGLGLTIEPDVILPLTAEPLLDDLPLSALRTGRGFWLFTAGRLRRGWTMAQAEAVLRTAWPHIKSATMPPTFAGAERDRFMAVRLNVSSGAHGFDAIQGRFARPMFIVFALTTVMLILAAVNLASLALARAAVRGDELIVRRALGATRWRTLRPLACENLVLASIASALGVWGGLSGSRVLTGLLLQDYVVRTSLDLSPDAHLLTYAVLVTFATVAVCSLGPAWLTARAREGDLVSRARSRTISRAGTTGSWLVCLQICLSVVLVTCSGLLLRTLESIRAVSSGMDIDQVFVAYPSEKPRGYANLDNNRYYPEVLARLAAVPGVQKAAIALSKPAGGSPLPDRVWRASQPNDVPGHEALSIAVSPGFLDVTGIRLIAGRDFTWSDNSRGRRTVLVSETLARRLGGNVIGTRLRVGETGMPDREADVVGIVADARLFDVRDPELAAVYLPALQEPNNSWKCFVLRGRPPTIPALNSALTPFGYELVTQVDSLDYITDRLLLSQRLLALIGTVVGALALLVAAIGLFGLMRYVVAARRRELGIRLALGADRSRIVGDVTGTALKLSTIGVAGGIGIAWLATAVLQSALVGIGTHDPLTFLLAPVVFLLLAVTASRGPALAAAATDPLIVMKSE